METIQFIFPREALKAALTVSLLSVWVLVGLFLYLNYYTRRKYFSIWTVAWMFYAMWLTLNLSSPAAPLRSTMFVLQHCCVGISALFLFWGSLTFLGTVVRQTLIGLCVVFLLLWSYASRLYVHDALSAQLPIFLLTGLASISVGFAFYRLGRRMKLVGAGLLFFGFVLWGLFLGSYPFAQRYEQFISATFLLSTILHLFIAVSMIVLVLEEVRQTTEQMRREVETIRAEKQELQVRMLTVEQASSALMANKQLPDELQKAYEELRRTQHSVVQQERLRALGQMASGIAHDINNALSPVVAFSELLLKTEKTLSANARKNLEYIRTAGEDIANIVARMRDFYRRRTSHDPLCNLDVRTIIAQVIDMTRPRWRDIPQKRGVTIDIKTEIAPDLLPLNSQETELREALTNLIANSVDAMPAGGTITLSARTRKANETDASGLVIEVFDTGTGMSDEVKKHCLEPFFSTKEKGGTGLGLAMVYGMMERHHGKIEIDSEPGRGTTIRLVFPFQTAAASSMTVRAAAVSTSNAALRILCIDDEPLLRELMEEVLKQSGHGVEVADTGANGIAAFTQAREQDRPFDLVITDLGMPGTNGLQVAREIKQASPNTPVLLLTGWGAIVGEDAMDASAVDLILSKPPNIPQLLEAISKTCHTQRLAA